MAAVRQSRCPLVLVVCFLVAAYADVLAQTPPGSGAAGTRERTRVQGGFGILGGVPVGKFATHVPDGAGGALGHLDVGVGQGIVSVGGEIGWMNYGDDNRTVSIPSLIIPAAGVDAAKVNTSNSMFTVHGRVRVQKRRGRWRPYADGLLGFMDLYTKSHIDGASICFVGPSGFGTCSDTGPTETHARDFTISYGAGGGIMFGFSAREGAPRLDLFARYMGGGAAEYLTEGAVRVDGDRLVLDFSRSNTNMVVIYIGVAFGR